MKLMKIKLKRFLPGHGTFVGKVRIEPKQPIFIDIASIFHFGASTRRYILRAKLDSGNDDDEGNKDLLPEEHELEVKYLISEFFFRMFFPVSYYVLL